jgi:tetratricopeptide (TPR) repeat protein
LVKKMSALYMSPAKRRLVRRAGMITVVAMAAALVPINGAEYKLPDATELQYFSPEAQQFYAAGVAALDKADYRNAYDLLAKASALQPTAVRLNRITADLSVFRGRQSQAEDSREYYETAIHSYNNILRIPTLDPDYRREVMNQLKIATQERDNLAQRDVIREAVGTTFFLDQNRKYAQGTPRIAGRGDTPTTITATPELYPGMVVPGTPTPVPQPGQPGYVDPSMMQPGMQPGFPGQPGAFPGQPGAEPII